MLTTVASCASPPRSLHLSPHYSMTSSSRVQTRLATHSSHPQRTSLPPLISCHGGAPQHLFLFLLIPHLDESIIECQHRLRSSRASDKNKVMVEQLKRSGKIKSGKVAEVMETIDRGLFVPSGGSPYFDSPMQIECNATISAPHMHAACLELLEKHLQPGMKALDVGSGTGYLTACFALMVGSEGRAVGVEHIPQLVASSIENIKKSEAAQQLNDDGSGSLSIHIADGREGWPELAPYDAIHVGAAALQIPEALIKQLKPGGRMVIPVGTVFQELKVVDKKEDGTCSETKAMDVRYVPLTSKDAQLRAS